MATYDAGQQIKNSDAVTLLSYVNTLLSRTGGMGTSAFSSYTPPVSASTSVSANAGTSATSAQAAGLRIIQHLLKSGYMNVSPTQQAAATALINQTYPDAGTSMVALTNAYTVVNYWNSGNSDSAHYGCNAACIGYCASTCGGGATLGSGMCDICSASCSTTCNVSCRTGCSEDCKGGSRTSCGSCTGNCVGSCSSRCTSNCWGCSAGCGGGCKTGCSSGCGSACQGTCTFGSNAH